MISTSSWDLVTWSGRSGRKGVLPVKPGRLAARTVENLLMGLGLLVVVKLCVGGLSLVAAARIWGSFWTHFADADPSTRAPVLWGLLAGWAALTLFVAWLRAPRIQQSPI